MTASFDDYAIDAFAEKMKVKMRLSAEKGKRGWNNPTECSPDYLRELLTEHVGKGDPVDVANFCMMLNFYGEGTV